MEKTKLFIESNSKWQVLNDYILRIEKFKENFPELVIENCKSLLESIFKTIIIEIESKTGDDLKDCDIGNLAKQVKKILCIDIKEYHHLISGFAITIRDFRNKIGETSHGKDIYTLENSRNLLFEDEISFLLSATDDISYFLLSYYKNLYPKYAEKKKELIYENYQDFNEWLDEREPEIYISGISLLPSKVLFDGDEEAYKENLSEYLEKNDLIKGLKSCHDYDFPSLILELLSVVSPEDFSHNQIFELLDILGDMIDFNEKDLDLINMDAVYLYKELLEKSPVIIQSEVDRFMKFYNNLKN